MIEVTVAHLGLDRTTNTPVVILREKDGSLVGLGGDLRRVVISAVKENTYFAELLIRRDDHVFQVDARPSDSIALALRMRAPIFTSDQLLDQSGVETDEPSPNPSLEADKLKDYLEKMDPQDFGKFNP